jgi:hypothetical protein
MTRLLAPEAPESFAVALLPSNDRPIVRLPENRRRAFRDHLRRLIGRAAAQRAAAGSSAGIASGPAHAAAENRIGDEAAASGRACATCGGRCCQPGREHAFQTTADIRRYMAAHPRAHPQQLLEAYLSRLPDRSYQDSCVYHAEIGCVLPHEMRSQTCKAFQCEEIEEFRNGLREPSFRGGIAVAICDDEIVRTAFLGEAELSCSAEARRAMGRPKAPAAEAGVVSDGQCGHRRALGI